MEKCQIKLIMQKKEQKEFSKRMEIVNKRKTEARAVNEERRCTNASLGVKGK